MDCEHLKPPIPDLLPNAVHPTQSSTISRTFRNLYHIPKLLHFPLGAIPNSAQGLLQALCPGITPNGSTGDQNTGDQNQVHIVQSRFPTCSAITPGPEPLFGIGTTLQMTGPSSDAMLFVLLCFTWEPLLAVLRGYSWLLHS